MTLKEDIFEQIEKEHNVLTYKQDLYNDVYKTKTRHDNWAYISSPKRGKRAIEILVQTLSQDTVTKNKSVAALLDIISEITEEKTTIIFINNLEQMNKRTLDYYQELITMNNLYLVANINEDTEFIDQTFLENFVILSDETYTENRTHSINVKYTMLLLLSVLIFLLFIRLQLSVVSYIVSALWFTLLMYRSMYYIIR